MGTQKSRQQKQDWMIKALRDYFKKKLNPSLPYFISEFCYFNYSYKKTADELLHILKDRELIKIEGGFIYKGKKWK